MWINGSTHAGSGAEREVVNPATGAVVDTTTDATPDDVDAAVEAATTAAAEWAATDVTARAKLLRTLADALADNSDELVATLVAEQGKPLLEANGEFHHMLSGLRYYAESATKVRGVHQELPSQFGPAYGLVKRHPFGVVGAIMPWNFPLTLLANKLGPALAAGNTVVAKPAETTPLATLQVARIATEAGLPDGVFNVVTGGGETGGALVGHPDVPRIAFTGSTATGRTLMETAGPALKHVSLELGGSDPTIVLPDADLETAVKTIQIGRYWNAGQVCLAPKRAFVHADVFDQFVELLSGRIERYEPGDGTTKPDKPKLRIGPLHTAAQRDLLVDQVADAVDAGAELVTGGHVVEGDGHFYQPGLAVDVPDDSRLSTEEVFGPVLPVWSVDSLDEAIERANATAYGLGSSIWTTDGTAINRAVNELDAGMTWVNQLHYGYDEMPFGGTKQSGLGKEHGLEALAEYSRYKSSVIGGLG
ncbi:aldehyde dehydrogenase family protein [Salsipaludibacter albus]|uniref:aldehyde dehydrogenase family protein n=1 Tax=Salsipaludibacter albus TaxID=2849650 RepID=UPI001EE41E49|nr:aldehyde dehydrogenase family protein [Salsipaludibacter albus]MBY5163648.1 aldehyde dehydrogenase family protein [Salsipaludibacter albus]